MEPAPSPRLRKWLALVPAALIVGSIAVWWFTRERLPRTIRIATALPGGLYREFGDALRDSLARRTGARVKIVPSDGSVENRELLLSHKADVAIVQGGSTPIDRLAIIAPLYPEVVHVIARRGGATNLAGLAGRQVILGPPGSGMRRSANRVLEHYALVHAIRDDSGEHFSRLLEDPEIAGAIVTTGYMNADLKRLLATGDFRLLPIDAEAIATKNAWFRPAVIPRGLYREDPPAPETPTQTVATTALLVTRETEPELLIDELLPAIYAEGLGLRFPTLIQPRDAIANSPTTLHPAAHSYFNPPDQIARVTAVMEFMAAFKELSVALVAGIYLLWSRWRRMQEREHELAVQEQKDRLDEYLEKTLEIERAQMDSDDADELQSYLDQVTQIKLEALSELTHENLRSDQAFSIFILQCGNLINKIQIKIVNRSLRG